MIFLKNKTTNTLAVSILVGNDEVEKYVMGDDCAIKSIIDAQQDISKFFDEINIGYLFYPIVNDLDGDKFIQIIKKSNGYIHKMDIDLYDGDYLVVESPNTMKKCTEMELHKQYELYNLFNFNERGV